jgi:transcriptional regulator with XRE-family HTH domain
MDILLYMLGEEIRKARLKAGLSQEALADKSGLHRTYISLLERNKKSPTLETLFHICQALGVSVAGLIKKVEAKRNENR